MLTKMTNPFVLFISKQTKLFSYIRQAYDPCLRHGDELRSLRSCSTGSPACQGLRPRTPGCLIIAACFSPVPMFLCPRCSRAHVAPVPVFPCPCCSRAHVP